ncbi:ribonuclease III [Candidatus Saccharibacteria bacterium]|jgi:ribonuclease-3|nr:ribonuclease III [Candidatus Saccharibacteria bacterium]NCU43782.1 ribonuclease III [Candidatus Saccharibacteria bacterium]
MSGVLIAPYQDWAREKLGYEFNDVELLITALTHRSYLNEHKKSASEHNERLEFLGDAVLELVVTDALFRNHQEAEGILTAWRSALVRTESIGAAGERLDYESLIRMSRGEKHGSARARQQILANAFEATTGAIYLDQGYDAAKKYIEDNILSTLSQILEDQSWRDPKSYLQEISQARDGFTPVYKVLTEDGPDHEKTFTLGVFVGEKKMGEGSGPSKQIAQQDAAKAAIKAYKAAKRKK